MIAKVSKGGVTLEFHSVKIAGDGQKKFMGEIDKAITTSNYGTSPEKKVLDFAKITKTLTFTGYLDMDSITPADTYAHTTMDRLIKMMDDCGVATLELKNNAWDVGILTWTNEAYMTKYSYFADLGGDDIPDKYQVTVTFMNATSLI